MSWATSSSVGPFSAVAPWKILLADGMVKACAVARVRVSVSRGAACYPESTVDLRERRSQSHEPLLARD